MGGDSPDISDTSKIEKVVEAVADSIKKQVKAPIVQIPVTLRSLIIPGALFAYGAAALNVQGLRNLNEDIREVVWTKNPHRKTTIDNYTLLVPAAAVYGLNMFGIKGQNNLIDRSVIYGMSNALANGIIFGVKYLGIETRPDSSDRFSFPSGHAAEAFVSAEFFRLEYRGRLHWSVIAGGYAVALATGYLRMYNNKHWFSDVVAGAGVGIASTRFAYYLYPWVKHIIFGSRKIKGNAMLLPSYRIGGGYGFTFISQF